MCYINDRDREKETKSVEVQVAAFIEGKTAETQTTRYSSHERQTQTMAVMTETDKTGGISHSKVTAKTTRILPITTKQAAAYQSGWDTTSKRSKLPKRKRKRKSSVKVQIDGIRLVIYPIVLLLLYHQIIYPTILLLFYYKIFRHFGSVDNKYASFTRRLRSFASYIVRHFSRETRGRCQNQKFKLKFKKAKRRTPRGEKRNVVIQNEETQTEQLNITLHQKLENQVVDVIFQNYLESRQRGEERSEPEHSKLQKYASIFPEEHLSPNYSPNSLTAKQLSLTGSKCDELTALKQHLFQRYIPYPKGNVVGIFYPMTLDEHFASHQNGTENASSTAQSATSMNIEMLRLETFQSFPLSSKARPIHLAKCGFFYIGRGEIVECFSCGVRHNDWTETDKVFEVHRRISPSCRFMLNQDETNVPISPPHGAQGNSSGLLLPNNVLTSGHGARSGSRSSPQSNISSSGLQTTDGSQNTSRGNHLDRNLPSDSFQNAQNSILASRGPEQFQGQSQIQGESSPAIVSSSTSNRPHVPDIPTHLMQHSTNQSTNQTIQTSSSHQTLTISSNDSTETVPTSNHNIPTSTGAPRSNNQNGVSSAHSESRANTRSSATDSTASVTHSGPSSRQAVIQRLDPLGINFDRPRYPAYAILTVRISSFQNWPAHKTQTPRQMASAGFLYAGYGDYARCFFCGGGLRNWEAGDDPWVEHARWFPRCAFLRQNKGDQFVALVQEQHQEEERRRNGDNQPSTSGGGLSVHSSEEGPLSVAVQSVTEMGYSADQIKGALEILKQENRLHNARAEDILDLLLDTEVRTDENTPDTGVRYEQNSADTEVGNEDNSANTESRHGKNMPHVETSGASVANASLSQTASLLEENRKLKDQRLCKVCLDQDANIAMLPCGHLCCCAECAPAMRKCPICRGFVKGTVKTWFA